MEQLFNIILSELPSLFKISDDRFVAVKKSRHEKYLFLISFFKSGHDDSMPCMVRACKG